MNEKNDFALVPRPASALEKAEPGAKRILSGMVADTLTLANNKPPRKRVFRVLTCSGEMAIRDSVKVMVQEYLGNGYAVEVTDSHDEKEILTLVEQRPVDLIAAMVNNILILNAGGENRILKAVELLGHLKAQYGVPVIAFSPFIPEFVDLVEALKQNRIDTFFPAPFTSDDFGAALRTCLNTLALVQKTKLQPLRIFVVHYEKVIRRICKIALQNQFEGITILEFEDGDEAWRELSRTTPDLLITLDVMPGMPGEEIVRRLADKKATCPIIVLSGWGDRSEHWVRSFSNRGLNVSLLQMPFDKLTFLKAVETALKTQRVTIEKSVETTPQPRKSRPLRFIMVCSEPAPFQSLEFVIRLWFKDATFRLFKNNGEEAWQELSRTDPDLLIMADAMPMLRGEEIGRRLLDRKATYPIIVTSAFDPTADWVREFASRGLNVRYLAMPFTIEDVRMLLEASLKIPLDRNHES